MKPCLGKDLFYKKNNKLGWLGLTHTSVHDKQRVQPTCDLFVQ